MVSLEMSLILDTSLALDEHHQKQCTCTELTAKRTDVPDTFSEALSETETIIKLF